jgi:hypothetical protein
MQGSHDASGYNDEERKGKHVNEFIVFSSTEIKPRILEIILASIQ